MTLEMARPEKFITMAATFVPVSPIRTVIVVPEGIALMLCFE
jgi:hypothetical protein